MEIREMSALELGQAIKAGKVTARQAVTAYLDEIKEKDTVVNAYITVLADEALARADEVQKKIDAGEYKDSPLAGVPVAIKDNMCTEGVLTTAASRILSDFRPPYSATVVEKLNAAGAIIIGKVNMDEFAMGGSTETSYYGVTTNPWDKTRVPGGSSGGSAAAVASGMAPYSLGSDTGGSIRQPAAFTGLTGIKPTYGSVSRYGLLAYASSLDQIGPLAHDVNDAAAILEIIAGHDPKDSTSIIGQESASGTADGSAAPDSKHRTSPIGDASTDAPDAPIASSTDAPSASSADAPSASSSDAPSISSTDASSASSSAAPAFSFTSCLADPSAPGAKIKGMKIGIPTNYYGDGLDPEIKDAILAAAKLLEANGAVLENFDMPIIDYAVPAYYIIACAEASSNLSRYDGIKYGHRTTAAADLIETYYKSRSEGFGTEVKRRIMLGSFVLSSGYFDAYYKKALQVRGLIKKAFDEAYKKYDMILSPVSPTVAYEIGGQITDPIAMYMADIYTVSVNLAGLPAISLPCGFAKNGLPIGMQLIGDSFAEKKLITMASAYQALTDYHKKRPEIFADIKKGGAR